MQPKLAEVAAVLVKAQREGTLPSALKSGFGDRDEDEEEEQDPLKVGQLGPPQVDPSGSSTTPPHLIPNNKDIGYDGRRMITMIDPTPPANYQRRKSSAAAAPLPTIVHPGGQLPPAARSSSSSTGLMQRAALSAPVYGLGGQQQGGGGVRPVGDQHQHHQRLERLVEEKKANRP